MPTNSKVRIFEPTNLADIETQINAVIAAEEANGFGAAKTQITNYTDVGNNGASRRMVVIVFNKLGGSA